jgi:hypothetical protein
MKGTLKMWELPFVSRERFDDQRVDLNRLRDDLDFERARNQKLWNFLNWRVGGGVAFDPDLLPEAYQPHKPIAGRPPEQAGEASKALVNAARAPKQARRELALFEVQQQQKLEEMQGHSRPLPKEQAEVVARLNDTITEAQKAAGD